MLPDNVSAPTPVILQKKFPLFFNTTHFCVHYTLITQRNSNYIILYIKMNVSLYGTYKNPHFCTDLNQTLHTSPPWSGVGCKVCMDSKYFNYPAFFAYFVDSECRFVRGRWLPAPVPSYCVISVMQRVLV